MLRIVKEVSINSIIIFFTYSMRTRNHKSQKQNTNNKKIPINEITNSKPVYDLEEIKKSK